MPSVDLEASSSTDVPSVDLEASVPFDLEASLELEASEVLVNEGSSSILGVEADDVQAMTTNSDGNQTLDLGQVIKLKSERSPTDAEKFYLLKNHLVPMEGFKFPSRVINGQKRCFQPNWLKKYNGLTYSPSENGGFCLYCVLFGQCEPSVKELGTLVNKPLTNHGCRKGFRIGGGGHREIARIRSSCTYVTMGYKLKQMHYLQR